METFKKIIKDSKRFNSKIKTAVLGGFGEPLLHPQIDEMVLISNEGGVEQTEIVTNASLLTKDMSDRLIKAGLKRLRISIEGTSSEKYQEVCDVKLDFEKLVSNISYFYQAKKETKVYIKIIDFALKDEKDRQYFFDVFDKISDYIHVECLAPFMQDIDYTKLKTNLDCCVRGNALQSIALCAQPFYTLAINTDGGVFPCCNLPRPIELGNVNITSLKALWESKSRIDFLRVILSGEKEIFSACRKCELFRYVYQQEDELDKYRDKIIKRFLKRSHFLQL